VLIYFETSGFGMPSYQVIGIDTTKGEYFVGENTKYEEGREIYDGEREVASVGSTVASTFNLGIGDYFAVKDIDFEVVGILEPTGISDIDVGVVVPLEDLKLALKREDFQYIYVIPDDITKTETIAEEIEDADENLKATTSSQIAEQAASIVDQVRFFTMGIGAVAAFVGGLGVMNTMIMAVMERRREIGVMKAIGATNSMILQQILTESAMISLIGGVGGVLLGTLGAMALGSLAGGQITATVTPGLAATGIAFALFLGVVGGFYPARNAAKLDPVETLRYE
jgi:putative ABC transport system permease protein